MAVRPPPVVAIGASTGGVEGVRAVLASLPPDAPPIVIAQHMPAAFTPQFARRLDGACRLRVREARDGDALAPGLALVVPGGRRHLVVARDGVHLRVRLVGGPPVNHHVPSIDVLFRSCADAIGPRAIGVLLTGMGSDGADGLLAIREAGGHTIAQDRATSVVFGMPREAIARGAARAVLPLTAIGAAIVSAAVAPPEVLGGLLATRTWSDLGELLASVFRVHLGAPIVVDDDAIAAPERRSGARVSIAAPAHDLVVDLGFFADPASTRSIATAFCGGDPTILPDDVAHEVLLELANAAMGTVRAELSRESFAFQSAIPSHAADVPARLARRAGSSRRAFGLRCGRAVVRVLAAVRVQSPRALRAPSFDR